MIVTSKIRQDDDERGMLVPDSDPHSFRSKDPTRKGLFNALLIRSVQCSPKIEVFLMYYCDRRPLFSLLLNILSVCIVGKSRKKIQDDEYEIKTPSSPPF
jgi:hypothetical protein